MNVLKGTFYYCASCCQQLEEELCEAQNTGKKAPGTMIDESLQKMFTTLEKENLALKIENLRLLSELCHTEGEL